MSGERFEVIPLRDEPEVYTWTSPKRAEYFTVYERDADDLAWARADLRTLDEALTFALQPGPDQVLLWTGEMYVEVSAPFPRALLHRERLSGKA